MGIELLPKGDMTAPAGGLNAMDEFMRSVAIVACHYANAPRSLDSAGRCCGRKPMSYRRPPRLFCPRCDRQYDPETKQQQANWAWRAAGGGFVAVYPKRASAAE